MNAELSELILSSTSSSLLSLHSLSTGSSVLTFKSSSTQLSSASTSTPAAESTANGEGSSKSTISNGILGKSTGYVTASNGEAGFLLSLSGKDARQALSLYGFHKEQVIQRFIPPVRLSVIAVSNAGLYFAAGTLDGRILLWDLPTGQLLQTLDAHYRTVSVLSFSSDDAALISGSEDAGISVWSLGSLVSKQGPQAPFATLADHTLPITGIIIGAGNFPNVRVLTSSRDSTCKIWDLSTSPPSLLSTFSFPSPITHIAWDPLERFFFAVHSTSNQGSTVVRTNLYNISAEELGYTLPTAVGGGGRGEVISVASIETVTANYSISESITSLHLSSHSPTLLIGTSASSIHILSLPSLLPTRIILSSTTGAGPITYLSSLLRPKELGSGIGGRDVFLNGLGRNVVDLTGANGATGGKDGRKVRMRIGTGRDVRELLNPTFTSTLEGSGIVKRVEGGGGGVVGDGGKREKELEEEVAKLRGLLGKATRLNEEMWKKVVENGLEGGVGASTST